MRKMIGSSVAMSGLLLWAVATSCAFSLTPEEEFKTYSLWSFNAKVKLLNDWNDVLKKSVYSYIPYHEEKGLIREPEWMLNAYCFVLRKHGKKYNVFYADISEYDSSNFLFIKDNVAVVYTPYLKIHGSKEKIYDSQKLKCMIREVEEALFQEKNSEKVMELVRQLHSLKEASYEIESYSKQLPEEVVQPMVKIMKNFRELQPENKKLEGYELNALYDYMWSGESLALNFYGFDSSLFGVSIGHFISPRSAPIYVGSIFNDLIRYIKSDPVHEQMDLKWLKGEMEKLPFVRDYH